MAENEYLDASKARRWQSVAQAIQDGSSISEVAERIEDCVYKTFRLIRNDLPFADLVKSLGNPEQLRELCNQFDGAHDVKDFLIEAAALNTDLRGKLLHFISQSLDCCLFDVPYLVVESAEKVSVTEARNIVQAAKIGLHSTIQRIADRLAENPGWIPQRAGRRDRPVSKVDTTERMLGESLLIGFRK